MLTYTWIIQIAFVCMSGRDVNCPHAADMVYTLKERRYYDQIEQAYDYASKLLLELLMREKELMARIRYGLLQSCDIFSHCNTSWKLGRSWWGSVKKICQKLCISSLFSFIVWAKNSPAISIVQQWIVHNTKPYLCRYNAFTMLGRHRERDCHVCHFIEWN